MSNKNKPSNILKFLKQFKLEFNKCGLPLKFTAIYKKNRIAAYNFYSA